MASWAVDWSLKIRIPLWGKLSVNVSQDWNVDLATSIVDGKTIMVSGTCVGMIESHGTHWSHDRPITQHEMQIFLHQLRAFCDRSNLIHANEKELVCALTAAPAALPYLGHEELMLTQYRAVFKQLGEFTDLPDEFEPELDLQHRSVYGKELRLQIFRCPFITVNGYIGIAPPYIQEGDYICIFPGGRVPYILRPQLESNTFKIVGAAHVHGIMKGEYFKTKREVRPFILV
jgi:hypothetical protein